MGGKLIEFRLHGERRLAVTERPDGKKNWVVVEANGKSNSIPPKQISYEVAGDSYKSSEIPQFLQEVETYLDPSSLEVAWEFLMIYNCLLLFHNLFALGVYCWTYHLLLPPPSFFYRQDVQSQLVAALHVV